MPASAERTARSVASAGRLLLAAALILMLGVVLAANTARALSVYSDYFVTLSARPLAMGGTGAALPQPASVFYNPAGLASIRQFTFLYNHSARHFPGSQEGGMQEWDQLDGDTEAIVVPLVLGTYAHGFTFSGEMGYDYLGHPADGSLLYPREHYWGSEDYDALATSFGLPLSAGIAMRRSLGRFTPAEDDPAGVAWLRHGEGTQWGILARVWPGLDYGLSKLELNYDWTVLIEPEESERGFPSFGSKHLTGRSGWALHPVGWLTLVSDDVTERHIFDKHTDLGIGETVGLGRIHMGNEEIMRLHRGGEVSLGSLGRLRWGDYDGHPTWGAAFNLGGLWLNYTEAEGLLPEIVGSGRDFENVHIYGAELSLW